MNLENVAFVPVNQKEPNEWGMALWAWMTAMGHHVEVFVWAA